MLLHNLHFIFPILICGSNAQIIIDNGHQTWQTSWARRVRGSWKKVVRCNIIVKMVLGNIFVVLGYWLLFTCVSADVCTKPEVSASAYTTQDATVLTSIAFVAELTLNCGNLVTGLPLYAEINGKTLPAARIGDGNKYQVSWTEDVKKARSGDYSVNLYDEEGYAALRKAIRSGEDSSSVKSLVTVVVNHPGAYQGPWVNSEFMAAILSVLVWYLAFSARSKLLA